MRRHWRANERIAQPALLNLVVVPALPHRRAVLGLEEGLLAHISIGLPPWVCVAEVWRL